MKRTGRNSIFAHELRSNFLRLVVVETMPEWGIFSAETLQSVGNTMTLPPTFQGHRRAVREWPWFSRQP